MKCNRLDKHKDNNVCTVLFSFYSNLINFKIILKRYFEEKNRQKSKNLLDKKRRKNEFNGLSILIKNMEFLKELWVFLKKRKKFWLMPIIIIMLLLWLLIVFTPWSVAAPFIYTLF